MCTVVYIPDNKEVNFASLRDESIARPIARAPEMYLHKGMNYLAPMDTLAGGTWLGIHQTGNVIILLNGGFEKHIARKNYSQSRGLIVKKLLISDHPITDWTGLRLDDIEPFTLVIGNSLELYQLVWDGKQKNIQELDAKLPHIWSSATLYDKIARNNRAYSFGKWIAEKPVINYSTLLSFFLQEADNENGFIINRNEQIKTQSYTFIRLQKEPLAKMYYHDFIKNDQAFIEMPLIIPQGH